MNVDENYNDLIKFVLENGTKREDRTGTGTLSYFGITKSYDISQNFPLISSKRVFWKGVVEELLWMLRGSTNANILKDKNIKIWDGNSSRKFLDSLGLDYPEGHLGPLYGHQWRHFNASYIDSDTDYTGQGHDQISEIINLINTDPSSRRIILSAWNPSHNHKMALPACHTLSQFYVEDGFLSCQLYQRSGDIGLGIPFNIASYSLLTYILAKITNLKPKKFIHVLGDAHIYLNHIDALTEQLKNETFPSPTLEIVNNHENIEDFCIDDFKLENYKCSKPVPMKMAV